MVAIRLRSSDLDPDHDITEEVKSDISPSELSELAKEKFGCFDQQPVKIYLDSGKLFTGEKIEEGQVFYATQSFDSKSKEGVVRLCVLGPGAVGKSALCIRFMNDHFHEGYDPTIEDPYRKHVEIDGRMAMLDILDTAGQEDFSALRAVWCGNKDGFVLVYAINDPNSISGLEQFFDEIIQWYDDERIPPILLVGNKADLEDEVTEPFWERAEKLAKEWKVVDHMKTSAKTAYNVNAAFANIVRATRLKDDGSTPNGCCTVL